MFLNNLVRLVLSLNTHIEFMQTFYISTIQLFLPHLEKTKFKNSAVMFLFLD